MNFIEIKKERRGFFRGSGIVCRSNKEDLSGLCFDYRHQRLTIYGGESVLVETDGKNYINYVFHNTMFKRIKSHFFETALCAGHNCITFHWKMEGMGIVGANYRARVWFDGLQYSISEMPSCRGVRLEYEVGGEHILDLGMAAYYWALIENSDHLA